MKSAIRILRKSVVFICFLLISISSTVKAEDDPVLRITGAVKHTLELTRKDLARFESVAVRLNEVTRDALFHGAFTYTGVPLRTLLEIAVIEKGKTEFAKLIDLAIVIENKRGHKVALSWGEVFYRNPADILVAYSALPIMPHKSCQSCHPPEIYEQRLSEMTRQVKIPKLVVAYDFYNDRSIEEINNITIIDLKPGTEVQKAKEVYSSQVTVSGYGIQPFSIEDLSSFPHEQSTVKLIGDGKGYHGLRCVEGVLLSKILNKAGMKHDLDSVVVVSAPDGYRTLLSYGELFLNPQRNRILLADRIGQEPIKRNGQFILITTEDLSADRWVKAVHKIEIKKVIQK
jgi:hypothetical protein